MKNMKHIGAALLTLLLLPCCLIGQPANWTPGQMMAFKRIGNLDIAPDGQKIAYTVSTARMDAEHSDFLSQIWVVSADGKSNHPFTFGEKSCSNPQFSPDGQYLAFTSARGSDGKNQIYRLRLSGGEAEPVSTAKNGVSNYRWSPDSRYIAFTMTDTLPAQDEKARKEKKDWNVVDDYQKAQLFVLNLTQNEEGQYPVKRLTRADFHITSFDWSPDGKTIVFAHQDAPWVNTWPSSDLSTVLADSGAVVPLVRSAGLDAGPVYSPDGRWIAYVSDNGDVMWARKQHINVIPAGGGAPRTLAATPDEQPLPVGWAPDSKRFLVQEAYRTTAHLYALPLSGDAPARISTSDAGIINNTTLNARGDVAFLYQTSELPPDVYIASLGDMSGRKLTDVNADFLQGKSLAKTALLSWPSKDGKYTIDGLLTYPHGHQAGRKYPLILLIHGGPAGVYQQNFTGSSSGYPLQAFAEQGYFVLRCNPRGSSGYGAAFRRANFRDWGFNDYDDLMAGVDKVINDGLVHPDSLCETGWSYGGYMTSMIITKTDRFKAVMAGAPVTNLMSFNGTADIPDFLPSYFGAEFWDDPAVYEKHSAMFHIKNATTPTLIIHGLNDDRVPPEQGFQLYRALQRRGVPTQMVTYPRQPHGFTEPKFIQDVGERVIEWFNYHLGKNQAKKP